MNIFFLSLSLTVKGSYIEQLIRVSDLYNFIRIRIQEIKKICYGSGSRMYLVKDPEMDPDKKDPG